MQLQHPFRAIAPSVDGDVLHVLASIHGALTIADLTRLISERSRTGIFLAAERLVSQGILLRDIVGRTRSYRLNDAHILAEPVRAIADARATLLDRLREIAGTLDASYVALFGSAATGTMTPESDIDIIAIRHPDHTADWDAQVAAAAGNITRLTGNDARIIDILESDLEAPEYASLLEEILAEGVTLSGDDRVVRAARNRLRKRDRST